MMIVLVMAMAMVMGGTLASGLQGSVKVMILHLVNRRHERPAGRQNVRKLCCFSERLAGHALFLSLSINLHPCRVAVRVYRHEVVLWWGDRICSVLLGR